MNSFEHVALAASVVLAIGAIGVGLAACVMIAGHRDSVEEKQDIADRAMSLAEKAWEHAVTALSTVTDHHEVNDYGRHAPTKGHARVSPDDSEAEAVQGLPGGGSIRRPGATSHGEVSRSSVLRPSRDPEEGDAPGSAWSTDRFELRIGTPGVPGPTGFPERPVRHLPEGEGQPVR